MENAEDGFLKVALQADEAPELADAGVAGDRKGLGGGVGLNGPFEGSLSRSCFLSVSHPLQVR